MKTVHEWRSDEPWKKHEPDSRLSKKDLKQRFMKSKSQIERKEMSERQLVKVIFYENWIFGLPDMLDQFKVKLKIPISHQEIMERMQNAFPGYNLILEDKR